MTIKNKKIKFPSWLIRIFYGLLMGLSDIIPGYSGGTTLTLLNFYDPLIQNGKGIFKSTNNKRHQHLIWLLPFLVFWIISFILLSFAVKAIKNIGYEDVLVVTFASFAFCCIPIFWIANKTKIIYKSKVVPIISFLIGFCLILATALLIYFLKLNQEKTIPNGTEIINIFKQDPTQIFLFFVCALIAGFFMIIPGISGSMITYLFNQYWTINYLVTDSINNLFANLNIVFLILFLFIACIGVILSILFCAWIMKKYNNIFYSFAFGMVCSSFIAILLIAPETIWQWNDSQLTIHIVLLCFAFLIGVVINVLFVFLCKKKNNVNFKDMFFNSSEIVISKIEV
ncbi:undecaprenyl phosphate translocase family protein [Mycoplasmoides alvi]|uniref:undecaprenyl phosphate translocase family protein n=1 Tax=Mycoplasmoides alvi TaxID=78580 RepID=UPI00051AB772|nr:DUF368 domain-containing protein [Mycoplasmoides alvi]